MSVCLYINVSHLPFFLLFIFSFIPFVGSYEKQKQKQKRNKIQVGWLF